MLIESQRLVLALWCGLAGHHCLLDHFCWVADVNVLATACALEVSWSGENVTT